jgi:hypothetical protein
MIFMVRWLVVGSGRCRRGLGVGVARPTSAADGRGHQQDGQPGDGGRRPPPIHSRCLGAPARPAAWGRCRRPRRRLPRRPAPWRPTPARAWPWPGPAWWRTRPGRDTRDRQAFRILDPASGHIQLPVDHSVPRHRWRRAGRRRPGRSRPGRRCRCTGAAPHRLSALLKVPGLVDDQHRLGIAKVLDQVGAQVIADSVVVPHRPTKQVLHPVRGGIPSVLGDRPAVLARQVGQQALYEPPGPPSWLHPCGPSRDPTQQPIERLLPAGRVYL